MSGCFLTRMSGRMTAARACMGPDLTARKTSVRAAALSTVLDLILRETEGDRSRNSFRSSWARDHIGPEFRPRSAPALGHFSPHAAQRPAARFLVAVQPNAAFSARFNEATRRKEPQHWRPSTANPRDALTPNVMPCRAAREAFFFIKPSVPQKKERTIFHREMELRIGDRSVCTKRSRSGPDGKVSELLQGSAPPLFLRFPSKMSNGFARPWETPAPAGFDWIGFPLRACPP